MDVLREHDFKEFEEMKIELKNLKETAMQKDYQMVRIAKDKDIKERKFKREITDMEYNIKGMKSCEQGKRDEISKYRS